MGLFWRRVLDRGLLVETAVDRAYKVTDLLLASRLLIKLILAQSQVCTFFQSVDAYLTLPVLLFFMEKVYELWSSQDCVCHFKCLDKLLFIVLKLIYLCLHYACLLDQWSYHFILLFLQRLLCFLQLGLQFADFFLQLCYLGCVQILETLVLLLQLRVVFCYRFYIKSQFHHFVIPIETLIFIFVLLDYGFQSLIFSKKYWQLFLLKLPFEAEGVLLRSEVFNAELCSLLYDESALLLKFWN